MLNVSICGKAKGSDLISSFVYKTDMGIMFFHDNRVIEIPYTFFKPTSPYKSISVEGVKAIPDLDAMIVVICEEGLLQLSFSDEECSSLDGYCINSEMQIVELNNIQITSPELDEEDEILQSVKGHLNKICLL